MITDPLTRIFFMVPNVPMIDMHELDSLPQPTIDLVAEMGRPRAVAIVFSDWANITGDSKANLIGVFDRIKVVGTELKTSTFFVFLRLANVQAGPVWMDIYDPAGIRVGHAEFVGHGEEPEPFAQLILRTGFEVTGSGQYWFAVSYNGQPIGGTSLTVEVGVAPTISEDQHEQG